MVTNVKKKDIRVVNALYICCVCVCVLLLKKVLKKEVNNCTIEESQ